MKEMSEKQAKPSFGILIILMVGAFFTLLSNTLMNVAIPTIMKDFNLSASTVQWLTTGYMLVNGILIPTTAFLINKYTVRRLFLIAIGLFTTGTVIAGFAPSFALLMTGRVVQASGSAIMMPLLMNYFYTTFPPEKRGSAMGMLGLVLIFAPAVGPTLSGWVLQHYDWPMLFHMITPVMVLVWILGFIKLHDTKDKTEDKIDILSVITSAFGFGGILYGFSYAGDKGWGSSIVYVSLAVGVVGLVLLIFRQLRLDKPMLDFKIYKHKRFALSSGIQVVLNMSMYSAMILMPIYLQNIRGISAFDSGLLLLPGAILMGIMSPITGRLFDKYGAKVLAIPGLAIVAATTFLFSHLTDSTSYAHLIFLYSARMFGISMVMMPITTNGLNSLPAKSIPHGTAMNSTLTQVSGAIGSSLLVTVMSNRTITHAGEMMTDALSKLTTPTAAAIAQIKQHVGLEATIAGINDSFLAGTGLAIVALILTFFINRRGAIQKGKEAN